jgi:hypothetical protein
MLVLVLALVLVLVLVLVLEREGCVRKPMCKGQQDVGVCRLHVSVPSPRGGCHPEVINRTVAIGKGGEREKKRERERESLG